MDTLPQRQNLSSAFIARLASARVRDPEICLLALRILRDTLETPRALTSEAEAPNSDPDNCIAVSAIAELLPAAIVWFPYCGHKIKSLYLQNQDFVFGLSEIGELAKKAQGVPTSGFSVAR
ncbi:hypothetical protein BPOR_0028g00150 [Botrytis porri]|uniref:Uncharacterized protein n=1 Tax=Botrytis porri TaxID=87229 RepID=A0A4Z1L4D2_9HELO|nr:hypothetical protein BPOR_0028g00150 [Botrytis porri]